MGNEGRAQRLLVVENLRKICAADASKTAKNRKTKKDVNLLPVSNESNKDVSL